MHVVLSTSPVALNWCSTQHAGMGVGTAVGVDVGTPVGRKVCVGSEDGADVGLPVGLRENAVGVGMAVGKAVGTDVGILVGAAIGANVGFIDGFGVGTAVGVDVGTVVSSSRRAPSRRPLDRRAFGPLRGGCCCPHANALSSTHRPRRSMLRALLSQLVCPDALLCTPRRWLISLSRLYKAWLPRPKPPNPPCGQPLIAGIGRGVFRVVRFPLGWILTNVPHAVH